jgi:hypothetical protein
MQIDRHVERLGAREDRPVARIVDEVAVRKPVDHRALEAEPGDAALELIGGRRRIAGRQRGEAREALRRRRDDRGEPVVDAPAELDRARRDLLQGRRAVRQDLDVDAALVHVFQARLTDIFQRLPDARRRKRIAAGEQRGQFRVGIMLLDRDDRTLRLLQHGAFALPDLF